MPELFLSIFFAYRNSLIAKAKGLNTVWWVFATVLAFLFCEFLAIGFVVGMFYRGAMQPDAITAYLFGHPVHVVFIYFAAVGGCLFVRYMLERAQSRKQMPDPEEEEQEPGE